MIVLDSGVLIAAADSDDGWHAQAAAIVEGHPADQLVLPAPVVPETAWMIGSYLGPHVEAAFVASVAAGDVALVDLLAVDWSRLLR